MKGERTFSIERRAAEESGDGAVEFALSSEAPYERWFGIEILDHAPAAVDLTRLSDGRHPLLLNHDPERQIGVIEKAWLDTETRKLRIRARFSRAPLGQEIKQDVEDDIRTLVSVGYMIDEITEVKRGEDGAEQVLRTFSGEEFEREMRSTHGDAFYRSAGEARGKGGDAPPVFRVTRWTPFEGSVVPIPADVTVGKGRAAEVQPPAESTRPPVIQLIESRKMENTTPQPSENEKRIAAIVDLGEKYSKYVTPSEVSKAVRDGMSTDKFLELIVDKQTSRHTDTRALDIGLSKKETQRYSFGNLIRSMVVGDPSSAAFEIECSQAMAKMLGRTPEGVFVPYEVLRRDFNVGTATEAGNLVATDLRGDLYVDALRASMVLPGMGVRVLTGLTGNVDIPRKATPSTLAGLTEIGSASETNPVTAKLTLSPKRVGAYVEVSKQAIIQSSIAMEPMLRDDLVTGAAVLIENYAIQGSSAANGTGLIYRSGLGTVTEQGNGTALIWDHLVDMETAAADANAEPDRLSGYLINTAIRGKAKKTAKGTNMGFIWDAGGQPLNGYRAAVTNNVPRNLTKGTSTTVASALTFASDWSMMVLGFFGGADVTVDPYSKADTGQVKITLNQFWDYTVRQPAAIVVRKDILTT
jgi:HK97 family phage major capsid protein